MTIEQVDPEARRLITETCLIAADVDRTIVAQGEKREREGFLRRIGPRLLDAAENGTHLALLTGNSMEELCSRVLYWLIEQLCHIGDLGLLSRFHFFCNSGGVYFHFDKTDQALHELAKPGAEVPDPQRVFAELTIACGNKAIVHPRFIDSAFIARSSIPDGDAARIKEVLDKEAVHYFHRIRTDVDRIGKSYDLSGVRYNGELIVPSTDLRSVEHGLSGQRWKATVQITAKPILSFRHAHRPTQMFGKDLRSHMINSIQERLDSIGLKHYIARPGGRSSIDVTFEKLDKAYALEFLIDRLNLQGQTRYGQKYGSNTIYFGDEVIVGGGNDYPVTRIPGLLVFAVNPDKELVPFLSPVFVPSAILDGPDATAAVLEQFNRCAVSLLTRFQPINRQGQPSVTTALDSLKREIFVDRIRDKIESLENEGQVSADDWQSLHTLITLMSRDDEQSRHWLSVLVAELDTIMAHLAASGAKQQPALGFSHPDW